MRLSAYWLSLTLLLHAAACTQLGSDGNTTTIVQTGGQQESQPEQPLESSIGFGIGGACSDVLDCRYGLICFEDVCQPIGNVLEGGICLLTEECSAYDPELYCADSGRCLEAGEGRDGDLCLDAGDCLRGLHCDGLGVLGICRDAGNSDLGDACQETVECMAGLRCSAVGVCSPRSEVFGFERWGGVECAPIGGPARPLFSLPSAASNFFELPYPNDLRRTSDGVELSAFPLPGSGLAGFDPVSRLVSAAADGQKGFSTATTVLFRFSQTMDFATLSGVANEVIEQPTIHFVNLDAPAGTPAYLWHLTEGAFSSYICPKWLSVRPQWHQPLEPGTRYAVYLTEGVKALNGDLMVADEDFTAVMSPQAPSDPNAQVAWAVYSPLRAYLTEKGVPLESVIAATVFTTADGRSEVLALRDAIAAAPAPEPEGLTVCNADVVSPCDDGLTGANHVRGCLNPQSGITEVHFTLDLPRVQSGQAPFIDNDAGGGLSRSEAGEVQVGETEPVCLSLALPEGGAMPEAGWPVVLYGHGMGATFREGVDALAPVVSPRGLAVLSWEAPLHGARLIGAMTAPLALWTNLRNPVAVRGSHFQGASDIFTLVKAIEAFNVPADQSPTGRAIRFDSSKIGFFGHGLGATLGAIAVPYDPRVGITVWSGLGASWTERLLNQREPLDVAYGIGLKLQEYADGDAGGVEKRHPVLNLYQDFWDVVDPMNHLGFLGGLNLQQHILILSAAGDEEVPKQARDTAARILQAEVVGPASYPPSGLDTRDEAVTDNRGDRFNPQTVAWIEVPQPQESADDNESAHRSWMRDTLTQAQIEAFFGSWLDNGVPTALPRGEAQ